MSNRGREGWRARRVTTLGDRSDMWSHQKTHLNQPWWGKFTKLPQNWEGKTTSAWARRPEDFEADLFCMFSGILVKTHLTLLSLYEMRQQCVYHTVPLKWRKCCITEGLCDSDGVQSEPGCYDLSQEQGQEEDLNMHRTSPACLRLMNATITKTAIINVRVKTSVIMPSLFSFLL